MRICEAPVLLTLACVLAACAVCPLSPESRVESISSHGTSSFVVLVPGLNQSRHSFNELAAELQQRGKAVSVIDVESDQGMMTAVEFRQTAQKLAAIHCSGEDREITWAGFSQGALLIIAALPELEVACRQRVVLFSPPVSLRSFAELALEVAQLFPSIKWPSFAPARLRRSSGVTGARYAKFNQLRKAAQNLSPAARERLQQARIVVSSSDELVSPSGILAWMVENGLPQENFATVNTVSMQFDGAGHALYDRPSCGGKAWGEVLEAVGIAEPQRISAASKLLK